MVVEGIGGHPSPLPWKTVFHLAQRNIRQRREKTTLMRLCLAIATAFLMSSLSFEDFISDLLTSPDVHTQALLELAGRVTADPASMVAQEARRNWILGITGLIAVAGISNILLLGVTERFREIGTMKCLGASDHLVVRLFLIETFLLGSFASLIGITSGFLLSVLQFAAVLEIDLHGTTAFLKAFVRNAPITFLVGMALMLLAALYPAWVASRMRPAEAMRRVI